MTPEQHRLRIQDIARMLEKADYGMGMPRDPQRVKELQQMLSDARKAAHLDAITSDGGE